MTPYNGITTGPCVAWHAGPKELPVLQARCALEFCVSFCFRHRSGDDFVTALPRSEIPKNINKICENETSCHSCNQEPPRLEKPRSTTLQLNSEVITKAPDCKNIAFSELKPERLTGAKMQRCQMQKPNLLQTIFRHAHCGDQIKHSRTHTQNKNLYGNHSTDCQTC